MSKNKTILRSSLRENPLNPRKITDAKFDKLCQSLQKYPTLLTVNKLKVDFSNENIILGGNMRYKALLALGYDEISLEWVEDCSTLTSDEKQALIALDNSSYGEWDYELLQEHFELEILEIADIEMPVESIEIEQPQAKEDNYEPPAEIQTNIQKGDLITFEKNGIELHRLLCGDSTDLGCVEKVMGGGKADMVFTSPPYNQGNGGMKYDYSGDVKPLYDHNKDRKTKSEYFNFLTCVLKNISTIVNQNSAVFWNVMYNANARCDYGEIVFSQENPLKVKETIIWDKTHSFPTASKGILSRRCELVFLMCLGKYYTNQGDNEPIDNYWQVNSSGAQQENHKACFPVGLVEKGLTLCSLLGGIVFEPFCGSGTTMVAAHQLNRKCYGIELSEKYCQVIIDRMKKLDSDLVVKINGIEYE